MAIDTATLPPPTPAAGAARQKTDFRSGNEAAALAAKDIGFHVMGYFPITPSTEVAENLARMQADGEHETMMIAGDGEHGAAGICYGAALGGGRVLNATSSQGLLYSLEQLPVQAGTRVPMVLNVAARTVSGPLDIRGDHSDLYFALNTGWIILCARDPQAVYDLNFAAVRIGEHPDVRLPVMVCYDGFVTSHQKRRIQLLDDPDRVRAFLGTRPDFPTPFDMAHPRTFGPYMNDPDLINNKVQLSRAMDAARLVIPDVFAELELLTGRSFAVLDSYGMDDAEAAVVLINSAAETAKDVADEHRARGERVGVLSPNVLRPFPSRLIRHALENVAAVTVGDRADSYGAGGGNLSLEVRAALQEDRRNRTLVVSRIYGLGGKDFDAADARVFFNEALTAAANGEVTTPFAYHGATAGQRGRAANPGLPPIPSDATRGMAHVTRDASTGGLSVELEPIWKMTEVPSRIAPGHGACPGCGYFPTFHQISRVLEGDIVVLYQTGCAMVVTTGYPSTAHRINYVHNLFQNGAATLSGLVEMYHERVRRGELPAAAEEPTFVMISGDGGMDIGMGAALGTAHRNHRLMILEYDNQGYMNTGAQLSYSTPFGHRTSTSEVGRAGAGKRYHHKDTAQIFASCHLPYVFTASEGYPEDLMRKVAKAQWYARREGLVYGKILSFCPLNWRTTDDAAEPVLQSAIDTCFFPLYEVEHGHTTLTYDPEASGRRKPVTEWLSLMGKTRHLAKGAHPEMVQGIQDEVDRRWRRLKAMHDHPEL
ncbi:MAG TPA: thiamine pyrophosphate-dependent enzyme [Vicinamibacterales bacterium]|nr:thiamine pyrophosphate-dependent enzyme [Vicinamibacterales bacterium]